MRQNRRPAWVPGWLTLREQIWERDKGICWACDRHITQAEYQLGHIVEHMAGGMDVPWNLAVMCAKCNQIKPVHTTVEEAESWRQKTNGYYGEVVIPASDKLLQWVVSEGWDDKELLEASEMLSALTAQMRERRQAA